MVEIDDFEQHEPMPAASMEAFRNRVPPELVEIWEQGGLGSFARGFIRVIDPALYTDAIGDRTGKVTGDRIAVPIMVTGLGDLITWEDNRSLTAIIFRDATTTGLGSKMQSFLTPAVRFPDDYMADVFGWQPYIDGVDRYGDLPYDQSFIFTPLPALGGPGTAETLKPGDTITAIQVATDLLGPIEH